ncbi:MAG: LPS-assembly protein LptD [Candidatus Acidiferrales bacterium]
MHIPEKQETEGSKKEANSQPRKRGNFSPKIRWVSWAIVVAMLLGAGKPARGAPQQKKIVTGEGTATLEADEQKQVGKKAYANGHVEIHYQNAILRADHVEYDDDTFVAAARGHVQLDQDAQHLEADDGTYNVRTGVGVFHHVRGTFAIQRRPEPSLLISPNPLYFNAAEVERVDEKTYKARHAWVTVCPPNRPKWKFYAPRVTIHLEQQVRMEGASFRFFSVPVFYLPYATAPASRRARDSGFMIPDVGTSSRKGTFFGDSFYWAPLDWVDATLGAQFLGKRGWSQNEEVRMRPWEDARFEATYYDVHDRGLISSGVNQGSQGGHEFHVGFDAFLPGNWRAVADLNGLSSLTFRLAFSETFQQAVNSEVRNTAFVTNSFRGFTFGLAAISYKDFLSATPQTDIFLRNAPEARFGSVPQAPWSKLPVYFGFDFFAGAVDRNEQVPGGLRTDGFVSRTEFAPNVTIPLRWGPWLGVTPSFTLRTTRYAAQQQNGTLLEKPLLRTTEEFTLDVRPPALARVWERGTEKWKHTIEPGITYRYVNGVNEFGNFLRFDENETLTDTSEVEYGLTQRLFHRSGEGDTEELVTWRLNQKYFFDPTFGGAFVPGQRNVFQALDSLTPFAFEDFLHRFSPIISDLQVTPGGRYDAEFRVDFDPKRGQATAYGTLLKLRPYKESFITLAHFSVLNLPAELVSSGALARSNQVRFLIGYGDLNRRGLNGAFGFSYDIGQQQFQNQIIQVSYNGSCCGIGFEYRRLALGNVRVENQYRILLLIANIGSAGNLRRQEKIF